jgi:fluoride exporter
VYNFFLISIAAVLGANARYLITRITLQKIGSDFPYGTLAINVLGSLIIGFFMAGPWKASPSMKAASLFVAVGFCGGFTTFSSYAFDSITLFERGQWFLAGANILSNNVLSLAAVLLGVALARAL